MYLLSLVNRQWRKNAGEAAINPPMPSLKSLAISGTLWTFFGYGFSQALRLFSNLIMTHLLVPEMFGLMALVNVFLIGLNLFSDIGVGPSIIRSNRGDDPLFINTAWTIQAIRGGILWICCFVIAWPIALAYGDMRLFWLIPVVGFTTVITGFSSINPFILNRQLRIKELTLFDIKAQIFSIPLMIIWAWFNPTIWALIIGNFAAAIIRLIMSHRLIPEQRNFFAWDNNSFQEIFSFGRWIFIATAMTFLAAQTDKLILGKLFSFHLLGIYTIAFFLAETPKQIIIRLSDNVIFPVISKHTDLSREDLRQVIIEKRKMLLIVVISILIFVISFGDVLITNLYDKRYHEAAWMFPILAIGIWPVVLSVTIDPALLAIGKSQYAAIGSFLKFIYLVVALPVAFHFHKMLGAIVVIAFADIPFYCSVCYGLWREQLMVIIQDLQATILLISLLCIIALCRHFFGYELPFVYYYY